MKQYYYGEWHDEGTAQDEREAPVVVATAILGGIYHGGSGPELGEIDIEVCIPALEALQCETVNSSDDVLLPLMSVAQHERIVAALTRPAQTAPQPEQSALVLPRAQLERIERRLTDWLELNCCECESGHLCGRNEVTADRDAIRAALSAPIAQTEQQPENKPGLGVNWRSVAGSQASVIERLQDQLSDRDKEQQELRDEIMQLKAQLDHVNAINSELLRGLKAIAFVGSNNELRLRSTHEVVSDHFGSKSLLCLGVKC